MYIQVTQECLACRRRHHINILSSSCIYNKKYVNLIYQHYCIVQCGNGETIFACAKLFLSQVTSLPRMLARKGCAQIEALYTYCSYFQKQIQIWIYIILITFVFSININQYLIKSLYKLQIDRRCLT